jgi:uncharacterized cupin superfamily protein
MKEIELLRRALGRFDRHVFGGRTTANAMPQQDQPLPSAPIPADWVQGGTPEASCQLLTSSPDDGLLTGVWECTPGRFRWYFGCDEVIVVLHGRGRVRVGSVEHQLVPGATVFFPIGTESHWEIDETLRKHFTHRHPSSLAKRFLGSASAGTQAAFVWTMRVLLCVALVAVIE